MSERARTGAQQGQADRVSSRVLPLTSAAGHVGPIVVAGSHGQSLLLRVDSIPREGETILAYGFEEPEDGGKATNQARCECSKPAARIAPRRTTIWRWP